MSKKYNNILKYIYGEKSMKFSFIIYADSQSLLTIKYILVIIILKRHEQLKKLNIPLLVIHCLHIVHLMEQQTSMIIVETKFV